MITKITALNKHWAVEQYFHEYSKNISHQKLFEEFRKYFIREKESYELDHLEHEIRQRCPNLLKEEETSYASSIS